ncbi:MAG TPA: M28 family peptidase [bacterium]|nr:M28 family peptidase [bacterium]
MDTQEIYSTYLHREAIYRHLKDIGDIYAPSQGIRYSRLPKVEELLAPLMEKPGVTFYADWQRTGNGLLSINTPGQGIILFHHLDQYSYLAENEGTEQIRLREYCAHRGASGIKVVALRFNLDTMRYDEVAHGEILVRQDKLYMMVEQGEVHYGDRIVFANKIERQGDVLIGSIDNAAGAAIGIVLAQALVAAGYKHDISFVFTDEDNGLPYENAHFCRGAQRFARTIDPQLLKAAVVIDAQGTDLPSQEESGARFIEKVSNCKGVVMPPHNYAWLKKRAGELGKQGIVLRENTIYASRGDDTVAYSLTQNVYPIGYPAQNVFFANQATSVNLADLEHLVRALFEIIMGGFPLY